MYITNTTENVKKLIEILESLDELGRLKFLIYILNLINNDQINSENDANPNLYEKNLEILNYEVLGLSSNSFNHFLQYLASLYAVISNKNYYFDENGSILGIEYNEEDSKLISTFEKLDYNEKLDVLSELFIRFGNETYFKNVNNIINIDGFEIARKIDSLKASHK